MNELKSQSLWRISNYRDLTGAGSMKSPGRWNSVGRRVVYLAESPSGAMLEHLAHLPFARGKVPEGYTLLKVDISGAIEIPSLNLPDRHDWREQIETTRQLGDFWLDSLSSPLARVPSVMMPYTWNCLLNPLHPDAGKIQIAEVITEQFDSRLFHFGGR